MIIEKSLKRWVRGCNSNFVSVINLMLTSESAKKFNSETWQRMNY